MKKTILVLIFTLIFSSLQVIAIENTEDVKAEINSLYAANKLEDALNILSEIPEAERTPQQILIMGNIFMDFGKVDEAEFMYKSAINIGPKYYKAYYNLGNIYLTQDKPNMAIDYYKLALRYNKEFAPAYYNIGCAYLKLGDFRKAKSAFSNAVYYKPSVADYHYNLAYTYKMLGKTKDAQFYIDNYNKIIDNF